jgi:hypothetical protein
MDETFDLTGIGKSSQHRTGERDLQQCASARQGRGVNAISGVNGDHRRKRVRHRQRQRRARGLDQGLPRSSRAFKEPEEPLQTSPW